MKQPVMDNGKFDVKLQAKVHKFEIEYSPAFDTEKVWKGIRKNNSRRKRMLLLAASIVVIIGLSMLFQQYQSEPEIAEVKSKPVVFKEQADRVEKNVSITVPVAVTTKIHQQHVNPDEGRKGSEQLLNIVQIPIQAPASDSQYVQRPVSVVAQSIIAETAAPQTQASSEIKVTFKRGTAITTPPLENQVVLKKFKIRIFEDQSYDTSAYASGAEVGADRKFKLKF